MSCIEIQLGKTKDGVKCFCYQYVMHSMLLIIAVID